MGNVKTNFTVQTAHYTLINNMHNNEDYKAALPFKMTDITC